MSATALLNQKARVFFLGAIPFAAVFVGFCGTRVAAQTITEIQPITEVAAYEDVRFKDMRAVDFSARPDVPATLSFNQSTVWPVAMPPGADPGRTLSNGMNPGLGVRKLHQQGWTGQGVSVAIIDQPLYDDHPEYRGKLAAYHDMGCKSDWSMHGPGVTSLLVGQHCGVAPDARVYFVAAPSWKLDAAYYAMALDWIVAQNEKLPPGQKIRVVSVSAAPSGPGSPFQKHGEFWDPACARAEKAGMLVLDCTEHHGFIGPCYYDPADPDNPAQCTPGFPSEPVRGFDTNRLYAPCSRRTIAEEYSKGKCHYSYWGEAGLSWSIPYCAGVAALGWQARPDLSAAEIKELLFKSACKLPNGAQIINPPEFMRMALAFPRDK